MKTVLLGAALTLALALAWTETATAQTQQYGTEVCVNASDAGQAKQLFPNIAVHVIADFVDPLMNGWRHVTGPVGAGGKIMTDAQEIQLRQEERLRDITRDGY